MSSSLRRDDPRIFDEERLWRLVHERVIERAGDSWTPMSGAFIDRNHGEMSVDVASRTSLEQALAGRPNHSVAEFTAGFDRSMGYMVVLDPTPDNPAHALVCPQMTKSHARMLARCEGIWVHLKPPL